MTNRIFGPNANEPAGREAEGAQLCFADEYGLRQFGIGDATVAPYDRGFIRQNLGVEENEIREVHGE